MTEFWDLYDMNKNKLGRLHERGLPLKSGEYHLAVEIWVKNSSNQILLTQRYPDKPWGSYWESTVGSVIAGEDSLSGAKRELLEETGIKIVDKQIKFLASMTTIDWIVNTYIVNLNTPTCNLKLQSREVINAKWVDIYVLNEYYLLLMTYFYTVIFICDVFVRKNRLEIKYITSLLTKNSINKHINT